MEINIKELKKWIAALDSGKFNQCKGALQKENSYCCLGVGCLVVIPEEKLCFKKDGTLSGIMPSQQINAPNWLKDINVDFNGKTDHSLWELNDSMDFSFTEIATLLELVYIHKILD